MNVLALSLVKVGWIAGMQGRTQDSGTAEHVMTSATESVTESVTESITDSVTEPTTVPPARSGPLAGVRVLDLTAVVLGPLATQILGDMGADVIKLEPLDGDLMRANGVSRRRGMSSIFLALNRNKRSLALDLKRPEGLAAVQRLLPTVDVLVHNMRTAAIDRLGLGPAACQAINPRLICCVATGFGEDGPDAGKPAFDDVIQAACGLAGLLGHDRGEPDYVPSLIADKTAGLALANAVLAALFERTRSGLGQVVEVPMFETLVAFTLAEHLGGLSFEPPQGPAGYARLLAGGRKPAPTRDGHVAMLPYTAEHWRRFFARAGRDDLSTLYGVDDRHARNARVKELYADMVAITRTWSTDELLRLCQELDIPATRIHRIDELPEHPHLKAVGLFQPQQHPTVGPIVAMRPTTRFSRTPADLARYAPELGEHSVEVLQEAGLSADEISALSGCGVLGLAPAPQD
jgi:crotonobetainyl-CoA:carnitine CoA-transferase CaiB-like acyl-CoA transferase